MVNIETRMPYFSNVMIGMGYGSETFETATTWDRFPAFHARVMAATERVVPEVCGVTITFSSWNTGLAAISHQSRSDSAQMLVDARRTTEAGGDRSVDLSSRTTEFDAADAASCVVAAETW